ncbi:MAG: hypothetical protein QS748_07775 [Candidatus Endonucleobacter bathymodioli]|uniref:Uncharacterized protein n=1 Tax=Candidatus Endonucleibacter bathymodioli TaxID=539814 RepID=A0AA90NLR5_9GAMM|nr:hypothetical protein [Candidatus Endonucleobacter bathymodioli]
MFYTINLNEATNNNSLVDVAKKEVPPRRTFGLRLVSQLKKVEIKISKFTSKIQHISKGSKAWAVSVKRSISAKVVSIIPLFVSKKVAIKISKFTSEIQQMSKDSKTWAVSVKRSISAKVGSILPLFVSMKHTSDKTESDVTYKRNNKLSRIAHALTSKAKSIFTGDKKDDNIAQQARYDLNFHNNIPDWS